MLHVQYTGFCRINRSRDDIYLRSKFETPRADLTSHVISWIGPGHDEASATQLTSTFLLYMLGRNTPRNKGMIG